MHKVVKDKMKQYGVHSLGNPQGEPKEVRKPKRFIKPVLVHDEDTEFLKNNRVRVT